MRDINLDPRGKNDNEDEAQEGQNPDVDFPDVWDTGRLSMPDTDISATNFDDL